MLDERILFSAEVVCVVHVQISKHVCYFGRESLRMFTTGHERWKTNWRELLERNIVLRSLEHEKGLKRRMLQCNLSFDVCVRRPCEPELWGWNKHQKRGVDHLSICVTLDKHCE